MVVTLTALTTHVASEPTTTDLLGFAMGNPFNNHAAVYRSPITYRQQFRCPEIGTGNTHDHGLAVATSIA